MLKLSVIIILVVVQRASCEELYEYMTRRNELSHHSRCSMSHTETMVNIYLQSLRQREQEISEIYLTRPLENHLTEIPTRSELFKTLLDMPKSGQLHLHEYEALNRRLLLEIIANSTEWDFLYICDKESNLACRTSKCDCNQNHLKFITKNPVPPGWTKITNLTIDQVVKKTTLAGRLVDEEIEAHDTSKRWSLAIEQGLFDAYNDILRHNLTRFKYLKAILDSEKHSLVELRRELHSRLFYFDQAGNEIPISLHEEMNTLREFKRQYVSENPRFVDFVFIIYESRFKSRQDIERILKETSQLAEIYPDLIKGFDLVGEEDKGHTLLYYIDSLLKYKLDYVFHSGETRRDENARLIDSSTSWENVYDVLSLPNVKRIGHGLGFFKRPDLYNQLISQNIAIEVCLSSNKILGYVTDLKSHPAINYYRSGIPITLSTDDPGAYGSTSLTLEYYFAYTAWSLDLCDLKTIALNSIEYSLISSLEIRSRAHLVFENEWSLFVQMVYAQICRNNYDMNIIQVKEVLPPSGPHNQSIQIHLLGNGYESMFRKRIDCVFGNVTTQASLYQINRIECLTPGDVFPSNTSVDLFIMLDTYSLIPTGLKYTFT